MKCSCWKQPFIWCMYKCVLIQLVGAIVGIISWFARPAVHRVKSFLLCHVTLSLQLILPLHVGTGKRFFNLFLCRRVLCLITYFSLVRSKAIVLSPWFGYFICCRTPCFVACVSVCISDSQAERLFWTPAFLSEPSCARAWNEHKTRVIPVEHDLRL